MTQNSRNDGTADTAFRLGYEYEASFGACSQCAALKVMDGLGTRNPDLFKAAFGFAEASGTSAKPAARSPEASS